MTRLMPESARKLPAIRRANHRHRGSPPMSSAAKPRPSRSKEKWKTTMAASARPRAASSTAKRGKASASWRCRDDIGLTRAPMGGEGSLGNEMRPCFSFGARFSREAEEVALAELDAVVAQEGIGGGGVEVEIRQGEKQEVIAPFHLGVLASDLERDVLVLGAVDVFRFQPVDEDERRRDTGLQFRKALFLVFMLGRFDA